MGRKRRADFLTGCQAASAALLVLAWFEPALTNQSALADIGVSRSISSLEMRSNTPETDHRLRIRMRDQRNTEFNAARAA